jgi:hypothetical protein
MSHASTDKMLATTSSVSAVIVAETKTRLPPFNGDALGAATSTAAVTASAVVGAGVEADLSVVGAADKVGVSVVGW